jgi:hypothetical protein
MTESGIIQPNDQVGEPEQKLLVSSLVYLEQMDEPVEVQRGMMILGQDKQEVGVVAAVVLDCRSQEITHILLGHIPPTSVYRLIPLKLIDRIDGESLWLRASSEKIEKLPIHQPD